MTGICREVICVYSPNPGAIATRSAYMRSRSLPSASRALTPNVSVPVIVPTSTLATGFALRLWYHAGWSGAPPFDATTTYRSPSRWYITGVMRSSPLPAPTVVSSISRSPNGPTPFPALEWNSWMVASFQFGITTSFLCLQRQVGREELDRAAGEQRSELCARVAEARAGHRSRREDCPGELAEVRAVLDERFGVPVSLQDDALGLIAVEVDLVSQCSAVPGPRDLHGSSGQALELLELAFLELEPSDPLEFTHR